jgi:hypothetical protein
VLLRIEALFGGRGDRFVSGTPALLAALPWIVAAASGAIVWEAIGLWVVRSLHRNSLRDWNRRPLVGRAFRQSRPSPWAAT